MKPLEALHSFDHWIQVEYADQFKIIEKALKRLETIDKYGVCTGTLTTEEAIKEVEEYISNKKKLKAFEIIKERQVDVGLLLDCETEPEYLNRGCNRYWYGERCGWKRMTQEEFDLLKEVLK